MKALTVHPGDRAALAGPAVRRRARSAVAIVSTVSAVLLAGCSSSSKTAAPAPPSQTVAGTTSAGPAAGSSSRPAREAVVITIDKFAYSMPTTVGPGEQVTVVNKDGENHTVTADGDGGFDVKVAADGSVKFTAPTAPGSYPFHCIYHSNMHGVLVVK